MSASDPLPAVPPEPTADDAPFWEAAGRGALVLPRCSACREWIWYPRRFCPHCGSLDVEWTGASGRGTVYSFTVAARGAGAWAERSPYVIAYVELEEGPRVLTNIVGAEPGAVRIGLPVTAVFEPAGATAVLRFTPSL